MSPEHLVTHLRRQRYRIGHELLLQEDIHRALHAIKVLAQHVLAGGKA